ncbi:tRNA-uridine aminocarboxypropyltransferase [Pseudoalteromonas xiamenensis]|uniref:tRNA-uridine aminocarboxypropyltransferase n=1 Tax=Pseudoalteromonas xiamenensis TaxID=882626 RepID=A0A975HLU5_9GAMM|nr:tRNA-uridine aminocarboxypropyltransferase [Pseudoalteromonas xiamenensis]QTH72461.1 DTW domain-containing protein [Pseudoalteromonas xiamenensis]
MNNSVLQLRQVLLANATRPFNARGGRLIRCETCLLATSLCICSSRLFAHDCQSAVLMLMSHNEPFKPSNTGRLIADIVPDNYAFKWSRTEPEDALLALLADPSYQPILVFPAEEADGRQIIESVQREENKKPLYVFLDGTWREAKRMFRRSPYLDNLPVLSITPKALSDYRLRVAPFENQLGTVEVATIVLAQNGEAQAAENLQAHFLDFRSAYLKGKNRKVD